MPEFRCEQWLFLALKRLKLSKNKNIEITSLKRQNFPLYHANRDDPFALIHNGDGPTLEPKMSWLILLIAGLLEVVWAVGLKYTHGFSRLVPSVITVVAMVVSMAMLSWAMKSLPVGTAYAVWTGIGAVGAAITGILLLGESASPMRIASLALIVMGIIGLKLSAH